MCPILAAAILLLCVWELITGVCVAAAAIFSSPAGVLQSMIDDRALLFDSTWHSCSCCSGLYAGRVIALVTGICIGWFDARPLLGNAGVESRWPDSRDGVDSAGDGAVAVADCSRPWA